jgi:hypothetical protein
MKKLSFLALLLLLMCFYPVFAYDFGFVIDNTTTVSGQTVVDVDQRDVLSLWFEA